MANSVSKIHIDNRHTFMIITLKYFVSKSQVKNIFKISDTNSQFFPPGKENITILIYQ